MSGDVQPRKRKDKRRKKEGSSLGSIHEPIASHKFKRSESDDKKVFDLPEQGEKIHVQNEHGVGGNICVKIVFFCLFGLLIGAVGLIYMKSLGSTDVDLPTIEESRFAEYFTGWLDESSDDHEHEVLENNLDHDHYEHDEDEEHDDQGDRSDHEEDGEHENEENQEDSIYKLFGLGNDEVNEAEDDDKEEVTEKEQLGIRPDVDEDEAEDEDEEDEEEEEEEENNESEDKEEEDESAEGEEDNGIALEEAEKDDEDDDLSQMSEEDEDKHDASQMDEDKENKSRKKIFKDEDDEENEDLSEDQVINDNKDAEDEENEHDNRNELKEERKDEKEEEISKEENDNDDFGFEEINVSEEDLEEESEQKQNVEEPEFKKDLRKQFVVNNENELKTTKDEFDKEEEEAESGGVAIKLGVGIALIIVAHLVLVKKWKSMNNVPTDEIASAEITENTGIENLHSSTEPVISRRQTLVPENVYLNGESYEEEMEDEQEEEEEEEEDDDDDDDDDEVYSEDDCIEEEFKKTKADNLETFEKLSWNIKKSENEKGYVKGVINNKKIIEEGEGENEESEEDILEEEKDEEEEEEEAEEEEVEEEEEEEEEEEDDDDEEEEELEEEEEEEEEEEKEEEEDENDIVKEKARTTFPEEREEEIDNATPVPPPRSKTGRGAKDIDEYSLDQYEESEEGSKAGDEMSNSGPEEQKAPEKKVGNEDEWVFRQELDFADEQLENNPKVAVEAYDKIISKKPTLVRALIGRAKALDRWAEKEKSNAYLKQAINAYKTLLLDHGHLLEGETYVKLAERCIERMRFGGAFVSAIDVHKALILKYPNTPKYRNTLAVTYLMLNKIPQARVLLNETLTLWPDDGFALVHYGFILKTSDNNMEEGAKKLMAGIRTRHEGVIDGMFFFHLGDALNRLGRGKEAMEWYELGVKEGLFLNKYQRSLYNVNRLKGQPWWTKEETTYQDFFKKLEENWREIRREGLELLNSEGINLFKEEAENLKDTGDWKQLDLYFRGRKQPNCYKAPLTCSLVSSFKPASTCTRGQIKFSVMLPNTHVWPHCGPTNCRLRSHLGLVVPKKTFIRVAEEMRSWKEGKFIIFDDSFEHEVWHNGTGLRLVLIVDVWHPELTNQERQSLSPI